MTVLTPASEFDHVKVAPLMGFVISPERSDMVFVPTLEDLSDYTGY
jgi:hypothetical protein